MAHGDYNCCAICDRKLDYAGDYAKTKEEICTDCLEKLHGLGVVVYTVADLLDWVEKTPEKEISKVLSAVGYKCCFYSNPVDEAIIRNGVFFKDDKCMKMHRRFILGLTE